MLSHTFEGIGEGTSSPGSALPNHSAGIRSGQKLLRVTQPFAVESVPRSWWYVGSTFTLMITALVGAGMVPWWPVRL